jgi:hypothetical protein
VTELLYVFDFDDTLAVSASRVTVTFPDGNSKEMTSAEYADHEYDPSKNVYDFSSFHTGDEIVHPIHKTLSVIHAIYADYGPTSVVILTARETPETPTKFLAQHGLAGVEVYAIGQRLSKADWLQERLSQGDIKKAVFYENSEKHIRQVMKLREKLRGKVIIDVWRVKQRPIKEV